MEEHEYLRYCDAVDASFKLARKVWIAEGIFLAGGFLVSQGTLLAGIRAMSGKLTANNTCSSRKLSILSSLSLFFFPQFYGTVDI